MEFTVLGLLGPAGSGKDLTADWLVKEKGFVKIAFADPMKRFAMKTFGLDAERLWGPSEKRNEMFEIGDQWWFEAIGHMGEGVAEIVNEVLVPGHRVEGYLKLHDWLSQLRKDNPEQISARIILQTLGTEWGRNVDELMWARFAHNIVQDIKDGAHYDQQSGVYHDDDDSEFKGVVIPDHRFKNEVEFTQAKNGYVLRLRRLSIEKEPAVGIAGHQSEAEQKTLTDDKFDHVFNFEEGVDSVYAQLEGAFEQKLWINTRGRS